jgi:hypothetical protein
VTREQYLEYDHRSGAYGSVALKDGVTYLWDIELGYAGTVRAPWGGTIYLLHPSLKIPGGPTDKPR